MSKAVSISEGGKGRIFPQTDKLKINNVGGGNSLWLPEEEVVTGTLYADENGIYLAENDGFSCYDTVVVRVEDETDPDEEDWELDLDELLDEEYEDTWDEESLEEFQEDPEAFEEKFNDKEKWKAEKAKKEKSQKIKKVKSLKPSKITGIDPVDGNPYEVGVDSEGNLTKEMLPSSIHIVVPPWKREYEQGEEINFYGMHVYLLDKDGHPFKSEKYPTGEIPFEELLLPITTASEITGKYMSSDIDLSPLEQPILCVNGNAYASRTYNETFYENYYTGNAMFACFVGSGGYVCVVASSNEETLHIQYCANGEMYYEHDTRLEYTYEHNGKTVHYARPYSSYIGETNVISPHSGDISTAYANALSGKIAWTIVYGEESTGDEGRIPVQWMRSDGETLEDTFMIIVSEGSGDNLDSGTSDSGTSDSGSGHTGGGF